MKNVFDLNSNRYDGWYDKYYYAYLSELAALKKVVPKKSRGLEIGSGTGRFVGPLGIEFSLEPSKAMREIARKRGVNAVSGYAEKLPYKSSFFDYAVLIATICFVKDPKKAIVEAQRVLKKNGTIIIAMVDKNSSLGRYYSSKKSIFYGSAKFYEISEIVDILENVGFGRVKMFQTLFKKPGDLKFVEKPLKGYGKGGFVVMSAEKKHSK